MGFYYIFFFLSYTKTNITCVECVTATTCIYSSRINFIEIFEHSRARILTGNPLFLYPVEVPVTRDIIAILMKYYHTDSHFYLNRVIYSVIVMYLCNINIKVALITYSIYSSHSQMWVSQ